MIKKGEIMEYPISLNFKVNNVFGNKDVRITLYDGLTTFVGTNASGKTQTLKALRDVLKQKFGVNKVRYLSSNRIGEMEQYRSKTNQYNYHADHYAVGDQQVKKFRQQIETSTGDFFTMDERKDVYIKVAERLSVLFNRQIFIRWDAGKMQVFFGENGNEKEYSVVAEASGLVNVISILAALFDEEVEFLLIDEPEVSLHPQLQSYLLREMKNAVKKYGKTIVISSHSAEMIEINKADDLSNFVFFNNKELPKQISPSAPELSNKQLQDFLIRMNLIYNEGFFAKKILLIEGASDMIMCRYLSNRLDLNLDVAGSQIIPVDGKGQFPIITKLFRLIGKEVCVLTDLDGFIDDNSVINLFTSLPQSVEIANSHGNSDLQGMVRSVKTTIDELIQTSKDGMNDVYEKHPYWINRDADAEENKAMRRSIIAQLFQVSNDDLEKWPNYLQWKGLKTRLEVLFEILAKLGCFVLKKGAVESYYLYSSCTTYNAKPIAAFFEISKLNEKTNEELMKHYSDLIIPLQFAALGKTVDESFAVKKELLSELALAIGILDKVDSEKEILSAIKQAKGNVNSLFDYSIINENNRKGIIVSLKSKIIEAEGFPLKAFVGDNVNTLIDANIHFKV